MDKNILYKDFNIDTNKCFEILKNDPAFYWHAQREYKSGFFQPGRHLFKILGIKIYENYRLGGLAIRDIQILGYADFELKGQNLYNLFMDLQKLNPQLRKIKFKDKKDLYDIILGIASEFNVDDIIFYIEEYQTAYGGAWKNLIKEDFYLSVQNLLDKLDKNVDWNEEIQWILSPKTSYDLIDKIEKLMAE